MNIHSHNIRRHFLAQIPKKGLVTRILAPFLSEKDISEVAIVSEKYTSEEAGEDDILKAIYRSAREGKLASVISINYPAGA